MAWVDLVGLRSGLCVPVCRKARDLPKLKQRSFEMAEQVGTRVLRVQDSDSMSSLYLWKVWKLRMLCRGGCGEEVVNLIERSFPEV